MLQKDAEDDVQRDWLGRKIEVEYKTPGKIVAIWSNTVFNQPGESPKRGLGGRLYFYDEEHRAVPVDGSLSIYVYDDTDSRPGDRLEQEASRAFHFDADELKTKHDPTEFGASYSLWLPWDEVGGERMQLGVIPVFTDAKGAIIAGEQSRQLLPGKEPVEFLDEDGNPVVQASYTTHSRESVRITQGERPRARREAKSSRIHLPDSMQKRLKMPPPKRSWDMRDMGSRGRRVSQEQLDKARKVVEEYQNGDKQAASADTAKGVTSGTSESQTSTQDSGEQGSQISALDFSRQLLQAQRQITATETIRTGPAKRPEFKSALGKSSSNTASEKGFLRR